MSRELTSSELADRANRVRISATHMPYFRSFSGLETRLPPTPDLKPIKWAKLTRDETKAKAVADKLKECDTMHEELEDLEILNDLLSIREMISKRGKYLMTHRFQMH